MTFKGFELTPISPLLVKRKMVRKLSLVQIFYQQLNQPDLPRLMTAIILNWILKFK